VERITCIIKITYARKKISNSDFAERFKILLNTDQKIILLDHQNNFVGTLKIMSNAVKNFNIFTTSLSILLRNYFDRSTKFLF